MADLHYRVVATSFPIVYTAEGDHDPAGLLYTLATSAPLLDWARRQWDWQDEWLPRAHERAQRIELLIDALDRFDAMVARLTGTPDADLLAYPGPPGGVLPVEPPGEPADLDDDPARRERRQHLKHTVDEAAGLLRLLTGGAVTALSRDVRVRARWRAEWSAALPGLRAAIEARVEDIAKDWEVQQEALIGQITAAMRDRALAERIRTPESAEDKQERARLVRRMERLVLNDRAETIEGTLRYTRFHPLKPFDLVRPLVLRARRGDTVEVTVQNSIRGRTVGFHRQGSGTGGPGGDGVRFGDGAAVGKNPDTTIPPGQRRTFRWSAPHEGIWPVNDLADIRGSEAGTNVHGLFGAFVVLPPHTRWRDPETGEDLTGTDFADGLYVDVHREDQTPASADTSQEWVDFHSTGIPRGYREFTIVFHDEPEVHGALHRPADEPPVMPISYRGEPLHNRLPHRMRRLARDTGDRPLPPPGEIDLSAVGRQIDANLAEVFWIGRRHDGTFVERVAGEEQHHSSWLFGDPVTPILRAYDGDPARVQLVHAGIKETHVFHLHVHQWRAVPTDTAAPGEWRAGVPRGSQLIDSITIGPQHGFTIDPLYGSGSRQQAPGDIIWHCHLYPHFHHGMWGLWRSFDREVREAVLLPDGSVCQPLKPLRGRPQKSGDRLGFPWFIDGVFPQKAPPPPARTAAERGGRRRLLGLKAASEDEKAAMVANPRRGALFVDLDAKAKKWNARSKLPGGGRLIHVDVEVLSNDIVYNDRGWHDPSGHRFRVTRIAVSEEDQTEDQAIPADPTAPHEPLFVRAHHGDVIELTLTNSLTALPADHFDLAQLPVECGLHVHLVKFDVLAADGSSTGWNYLSGASCREAVPGVSDTPLSPITSFHRWVVDEEFGPCFVHDHLLANYRQKHGLFAALVAEPVGSRWLDPATQSTTAWTGRQAVVLPAAKAVGRRSRRTDRPPRFEPFREACLAVGDFVPNVERNGDPLNPPGELGGEDDPGVMAVNYRSAPLTFRGKDPSRWFAGRDPDTGVIRTHAGDRLRIRLIQGSHEEQHSFVTHGLTLAPRVAEPGVAAGRAGDPGHLRGVHPRHRRAGRHGLRPRRPPVAVQRHGRPVAGLLGHRPGRAAPQPEPPCPAGRLCPPCRARRTRPRSPGPRTAPGSATTWSGRGARSTATTATCSPTRGAWSTRRCRRTRWCRRSTPTAATATGGSATSTRPPTPSRSCCAATPASGCTSRWSTRCCWPRTGHRTPRERRRAGQRGGSQTRTCPRSDPSGTRRRCRSTRTTGRCRRGCRCTRRCCATTWSPTTARTWGATTTAPCRRCRSASSASTTSRTRRSGPPPRERARRRPARRPAASSSTRTAIRWSATARTTRTCASTGGTPTRSSWKAAHRVASATCTTWPTFATTATTAWSGR